MFFCNIYFWLFNSSYLKPELLNEMKNISENELTSLKRIGPYVVTKLIGEGGMGKVWRAWKISEGGFKKVLAIKTSKSANKYTELFMNEAKISARFEHENIVKTFDFGKTDDGFFLVMEYIRGVDLKEFISNVKNIPMDVFFFIIDRILSGVIYIHKFEGRQLVHRDINQKNILVSWNGNVKISDFGITLPQHGDFDPFGKVGYVPPEVILGKGWSQLGDIWCIGVLMWEILTSRKLFSGKGKEDLKKKILSSNIDPPSQFNDLVSEDIDRIVMNCLSRVPESRYFSVEKLQEEIRRAMSNLSIKTMYQEEFSLFISENFSERIRREEKELAEEEAHVSIYAVEKKDKNMDVKVESKKVSKDLPSVSYYIVSPDNQKKERGNEKRNDSWTKSRKTRKKKRDEKIFLISPILGFVLGLTVGVFKGAYEVKSAENLFKKGVDLVKERNFNQAREFFQISYDISDVREVKNILDRLNTNNGKSD